MATKMKSIEMVAAAAPLKLSAADPSAALVNPLKVLDTMDVNAAITSRVKSQQNSEKKRLPAFPIYFSMIIPMDFPSFFTDA